MSEIIRATARRCGADGEVVETVPLTVVPPDGPTRGAIVVLHEDRDFSAALLDLMRALAADGWVSVAPDLFHRDPDRTGGGVFGEPLFADFDATVDWLVRREVRADTIGVLGFDDAGTAAMLVAATRRIGAAVSVGAPGIVSPLSADARALVDAAASLQAPWLALYGDDDPRTPREEVVALGEATARAEVASLVVMYSGLTHRADEPPHLLLADEADDAADEEVVDARSRIFDWFDSHLR